jgi:hypothetical protein
MLLSLSGMPYISESSLQKSFSRCSRKILCRFQLREVRSQDFVRTAQSCIRTPINVKKLNSSRLHLSKRHGNTSGRTLEFEKTPTFLHRHKAGRQLAPVRTLGQFHPDTKILVKEITCILFASIRK